MAQTHLVAGTRLASIVFLRPNSGGQEIVGCLSYYRMSPISFEKLSLATDVVHFSGEFTASPHSGLTLISEPAISKSR